MQIELTDSEAAILDDILHDYLPSLKREIARTDRRDLRHRLVERQEVCERVVQRIEKTLEDHAH